MVLTGQQMQQLTDALSSAFNLNSFTQMLRFRLEKDLADITLDGGMVDRVFVVIETAEMEGWTGKLVKAAHESVPGNPKLAEFVRDYGLASIPASDVLAATEPLSEANLERVVQEKSQFQDVSTFIAGLAQLEPCICRITYPIGGGKITFGTGFLVGPDLLMTNHHVIEKLKDGVAAPDSVECLFDYKKLPDGTELAGTKFKLKTDNWLVESSPYSAADLIDSDDVPAANELDYALLRLAENIGENPIGENVEPGAQSRGWVEVQKELPQVATDDIIFILQHPDGDPQKLAIGQVLRVNQNGTRIRHDANTTGGSSGSPAFTADLKLFGLHHAGDPNFDLEHKPEYNQAVPMGRIVDQLESRNVSPFWI
jgi:hypothetical protein